MLRFRRAAIPHHYPNFVSVLCFRRAAIPHSYPNLVSVLFFRRATIPHYHRDLGTVFLAAGYHRPYHCRRRHPTEEEKVVSIPGRVMYVCGYWWVWDVWPCAAAPSGSLG